MVLQRHVAAEVLDEVQVGGRFLKQGEVWDGKAWVLPGKKPTLRGTLPAMRDDSSRIHLMNQQIVNCITDCNLQSTIINNNYSLRL